MLRIRRLLACVLLIASALAVVSPASAETLSEQRKKREQVRQQNAATATQVDVLKAEDAEVQGAIKTLDENVAAQEGQFAEARSRAEVAEQQLAAAQLAEERNLKLMAETRARLRKLAVIAYVQGGDHQIGADAIISTDDAALAARQGVLANLAAGSTQDVVDRLHQAELDLAEARRQATAATEAAQAAQQDTAARLTQVTRARNQQAAFATKLNARIEARLAEAASLARLDKQLSQQIAAGEAALAAANRGRGGNSPVRRPSGNVPLTNVRGIWVNSSIADNVERLLAAAESDGTRLSGGGYRDPDDQRRLREQNCPDPENSPASDCSPPTARPGQSMHEQGLAIDFTYEGRVITSRSNPGYQWLARNAGRYGLYNLPSEPWHWSTNGN